MQAKMLRFDRLGLVRIHTSAPVNCCPLHGYRAIVAFTLPDPSCVSLEEGEEYSMAGSSKACLY